MNETSTIQIVKKYASYAAGVGEKRSGLPGMTVTAEIHERPKQQVTQNLSYNAAAQAAPRQPWVADEDREVCCITSNATAGSNTDYSIDAERGKINTKPKGRRISSLKSRSLQNYS